MSYKHRPHTSLPEGHGQEKAVSWSGKGLDLSEIKTFDLFASVIIKISILHSLIDVCIPYQTFKIRICGTNNQWNVDQYIKPWKYITVQCTVYSIQVHPISLYSVQYTSTPGIIFYRLSCKYPYMLHGYLADNNNNNINIMSCTMYYHVQTTLYTCHQPCTMWLSFAHLKFY